jgi:hypothetical protein
MSSNNTEFEITGLLLYMEPLFQAQPEGGVFQCWKVRMLPGEPCLTLFVLMTAIGVFYNSQNNTFTPCSKWQ